MYNICQKKMSSVTKLTDLLCSAAPSLPPTVPTSPPELTDIKAGLQANQSFPKTQITVKWQVCTV